MAVTYAQESPARKVSGDARTGVVTAHRTINIGTDTIMDYFSILADPQVQAIGSVHPDNPSLYLLNFDIVDYQETLKFCVLTLNYSSEREVNINPLLDPIRVNGTSEYYQRPVYFDRYGQPLVTSSNEYPEGLLEDAVQENITISRNYPIVPAFLTTSQGGVNSGPFDVRGRIFPPETCRLGLVQYSDELIRNGQTYYRLQIPISYRREGWQLEYADRGYYEFKTGPLSAAIGGDGRYHQEILLEDKSKPSSPSWLNGSGIKLSNPTPGNIVINRKDTKLAFNMNAIFA